MDLKTIADQLNLKLLTTPLDLSTVQVTSGYCSDLLSCVMSGAKSGSAWVTLMAHGNIVAVATLLDVAAIIITEDAQPDEDTLAKANQQGVIMLSTPEPNFWVNGKLWELGIHN